MITKPGFSLVLFASLCSFALTAPAAALDVIDGLPSAYQSRFETNCTDTLQCIGSFDPVPEGKVLKATNINCFVFGGAGGVGSTGAFTLFRGKPKPTSLDQLLDYFAASADSSGFRFIINESFLTYLEPGDRPRIGFGGQPAPGSFQMICKLTGTMVNS